MSHTPKKIGFFTAGPSFDGHSIYKKGLGGSETALIQAARILAENGNLVRVFNNCEVPGVYDGVVYLPSSEFPIRSAGSPYDVFIVSRFFGFYTIPFKANLKVLWNHDTLEQPAELRKLLGEIDILFVLSNFHMNNYLTRVPSVEDKMFITRNGLDIDLINRSIEGVVKKPSKVIYASRPERGLKILLENIWPRLSAHKPELKLYICGYNSVQTGLRPELLKLYRYIDDLVHSTPNVVALGSLPKEEYYRHLAESSLMLYPCTFPEISCIAALEAQACGTPIIATDAFALSETVKLPEFKVFGTPGTESYDVTFIRRAMLLLENPEGAALAAEQARNIVLRDHDWVNVVKQWERLFDLSLASRKTQIG